MSTGNLENLQTIRNDSKLRVVNSKISTCQELEQLVSNSHAICHLAAAVGVELVVRSPIHVLETNLHETELLLQCGSPPTCAIPHDIDFRGLWQESTASF